MRIDEEQLMPVDDQELRAITFLAMRVRRATHGCAPWDEAGLIANLRKIANRNLHHVIEHTMRHAADATAKSPGVLAGSFTPAPPKAGRPYPPKRDQECPHHPGQWAESCNGCRADELAGPGYGHEEPAPKPQVRVKPGDATAGLKACRDAMHESKGADA